MEKMKNGFRQARESVVVDLSSTEPNWMELYIPYKTIQFALYWLEPKIRNGRLYLSSNEKENNLIWKENPSTYNTV